MATSDPSMGHQRLFSIGGTSIVGWCTLAKHGTHLEREGMRGSRSHHVDDVQEGPYTVSGQIILSPDGSTLEALEEYILGNNDGTLGETLPSFDVIVDKGAEKYVYADCKVDVAAYSGSAGGLIGLTLDVVGKTEAVSTATIADPTDSIPLRFSDTTFTLGGMGRPTMEFELKIDNQLVKDRHMNSQTVVDLPEGDRIITLRTKHDFSADNKALYDQAVGGAAGSIVMADDCIARTYSFIKLQVPAKGPEVSGKGAIPLDLEMTARGNSATKELVVTTTML